MISDLKISHLVRNAVPQRPVLIKHYKGKAGNNGSFSRTDRSSRDEIPHSKLTTPVQSNVARVKLAMSQVEDRGPDTQAESANIKQTTKSSYDKEMEKIKSQLSRGEIPEELSETLCLVPESSEEGRQFQNEIESFAMRLYCKIPGSDLGLKEHFKTHDFKKNPVRFLLSKSVEPNAFFIKFSQPPICILTEGLFAKLKSGNYAGSRVISTFDELGLVLCHEITHLKINTKYGDVPNSKFEEGFADVLPLEIIHEKGLNPEMALLLFERMNESLKQMKIGEGDIIITILDVHPSELTTRSILEDYLAYLRKERGDLKPKVQSVPFDETTPLLQIVKRSKHTSYIKSRLQSIPNYDALPVSSKILALSGIIQDMEKAYPVRVSDLRKEIVKLYGSIKTDEDKKAVKVLANAIVSFADRNPLLAVGFTVTLRNLAGSDIYLKKLTRLKPIYNSFY